MTTKGLRRRPPIEPPAADALALLPAIGHQRQPAGRGRETFTVVVPTFNEAGNIAELVGRLAVAGAAAPGQLAEVLFVDDSNDSTPEVITAVAATATVPVRLLHREPHDRSDGLSGAVLRGIDAARTPWVLVMDADLQHPPEDVPRLFAAANAGRTGDGPDVVIASRYLAGGTTGGLAGWRRRFVSNLSTRLVALLFPRRLSGVTDAMTGFFAVRRSALDPTRLHPSGFKILLEILTCHRLRVTEVCFDFAERHSGQSKASLRQGLLFGGQLVRLRGRRAPLRRGPSSSPRAARFSLVGAANVVVDIAVFNALLAVTGQPLTSKPVASAAAIGLSWWMSRRWTWSDRPGIGGRWQLAMFAAVSAAVVGLAELCLLTSHYGLNLTSGLEDNVSANGVGLLLGMAWRHCAYDRWLFPARTGGSSTSVGLTSGILPGRDVPRAEPNAARLASE